MTETQALTRTDQIRETVRKELKDATTEDDKKTLIKKYISDLIREEGKANSVKEDLSRKGEITEDTKEDANDVVKKLERILVNDETDPGLKLLEHANLPPDVKTFIDELSKINLRFKESVHIAPLLIQLLKNPGIFELNALDEKNLTPFEQLLKQLFKENERAGNIIRYALLATASRNPFPKIDRDSLIQKLDELKETAGKEREEEIKNQVKKHEEKHDNEVKQLLKYFDKDTQKEQQRLAIAVNSEDEFIAYANELYYGGEHEKAAHDASAGRKGLPGGVYKKAEDEIREKHGIKSTEEISDEARIQEIHNLAFKYFSEEFSTRVTMLIAELHRTVDEQNFAETWQEATTSGNAFYNINTMTKNFRTRVGQIGKIDINKFAFAQKKKPNGDADVKFYHKTQKQERLPVEIKSRFDVNPSDTVMGVKNGKALDIQFQNYYLPIYEWKEFDAHRAVQNNFSDYISVVVKDIDTEIGLRRFLHDARALPFLSKQHDQSYLQMLAGFASAHLSSTDYDAIGRLFSSVEIGAASQMSSKMRELAFARVNWIYKSTHLQPDMNTGRTEIDEATLKYLSAIFGNKLEDWEINRILSAGIGDNFGMELSGLTTPAVADPELNPDGSQNNKSYGPKSAALYSGFNLMAHNYLRWSQSEGPAWWGLLYLPIEYGDHKKEKKFFDTWDFNKLLAEQQKFMAAFVAGKNPEDVDEGKVRFVDVLNVGKGGSVYDRFGWRGISSYEGWLVSDTIGKKDILKSWKAIENIGIVALKDFIGNIEGKNPDFYGLDKNDETKRKEQEQKRYELVDYLYRKYFVAPELGTLTEEQIKENIKKTFEKLEKEKIDDHHVVNGAAPLKPRSGNYKEFLFQTLTRAMVQRMPTKFIRTELERRRKVNSNRDRSWDEVFDLSQSETDVKMDDGKTYKRNVGNSLAEKEESYYLALQDIIATGEVLLRTTTTKTLQNGIDKEGKRLHQIDIGDSYNLTPERMMELWKQNEVKFDPENPEKDTQRKINAIAVLKATRKYLYQKEIIVDAKTGKLKKYLDDYASKYADGKFAFEPAVEELERTLLAHRAAGNDMPNRAFNDNVSLEKGVNEEIAKFMTSLYQTGIGHDHKFDKLVGHIETVRNTLVGVHGQDYAHRVALWMSTLAISLFKKNASAEDAIGGGFFSPYHNSLISFLSGGNTEHIWEWDRTTVYEFMHELIKRRVLPEEAYSAEKPASFDTLYKVNKKGDHYELALKNGQPIEAGKKRKEDYHHYAEQITERFLNNPLLEVFKKLQFPVFGIVLSMIASLIIQAYKKVTGAK